MFATIRSEVNILQVISDDLEEVIVESGSNTYRLEEDKSIGCPFCGHKDCFKIFHHEDDPDRNGYKCFSCDKHGDVINWRAERRNIKAVEAALQLADEYNVRLPNLAPTQDVFTAAAEYYENCLKEDTRKYPELRNKTPMEYLLEVRLRTPESIASEHIGWSDGGVISFLEGVGFDLELIKEAGLVNKKGNDFLPRKCFIYPHFARGRVSHFTFKDPLKKLAYQLPKKARLNGYEFYGQDSISSSDTVVLVEGENDRLAVLEHSKFAVLATIGQIGTEQIKWLQEHCKAKDIVTIFDPDEAGDKYRDKIEKVRLSFKSVRHVIVPDDMDIDEYLISGKGTLEDLLETRVAKREVSSSPVQLPENLDPSKREELIGKDLASRMDDVVSEDSDDTDGEVLENGSVIQRRGCYYRVTFKEGEPQYKCISDFYMTIRNVFISEDGERNREVIVHRSDGFVSKPILIDSEAKVLSRQFKVLMANAADASFTGNEEDLSYIWKIVFSQKPEALVNSTRAVGRIESMKGWVFRNVFISDSGNVIRPDEEGVFWMPGHTVGIRPESLNANARSSLLQEGAHVNLDIPKLEDSLSDEEADHLMQGVVDNLARNLGSMGKALLMLGWIKGCVHSNAIFRMHHSFPFLFLWGTKGKGKSSIGGWLQEFFDMREHGHTSVPQLRSGVGWDRKISYYASMPALMDEIRSDRETQEYVSKFRTYYDRTPRTMGTKDSFGVRTSEVRSCFMFVGEDQFEDPAARERCIPIRISNENRELSESYRWMEAHRHLFSGITFRWILDNCNVDPKILEEEIHALDKEISALQVCTQRISKNWSALGVFALKLAQRYAPKFDMKAFMIKELSEEAAEQGQESSILQFFDIAEGMASLERPLINMNHVCRKENEIHIWFAEVYRLVNEQVRGGFSFSRNAILKAIREEPFFIEDGRLSTMGLNNTRRKVLILDYDLSPVSIQNLVSYQV
jgi:5S rRNA maturation endonuclease (ribonuclease M5)